MPKLPWRDNTVHRPETTLTGLKQLVKLNRRSARLRESSRDRQNNIENSPLSHWNSSEACGLAASEENPAGLFPPSFRIAARREPHLTFPPKIKPSRSSLLRALESEDVIPAEAGGGLSHAFFFST
jgi:hypothetical protein